LNSQITVSDIIVVEISENSQDAHWDKFLPFISPERLNQIEKYRFDIDKKLSVYAEFLVKRRVQSEFGVPNNKIIFAQNEYGKPYLPDFPNLHFDISHTRNALAIAFSKKPSGIDIAI
jgi:4'-phosphopantetheinyl transferase